MPNRLCGTGTAERLTEMDEVAVHAALTQAHGLPGFFPVVLIARAEPAFRSALATAVIALQGEAPYAIEEQPSSGGAYVSYRVRVWVENGAAGLSRRDALAGLDGVLVAL